jgi:adenylate kinase family enzyme
MDGTYESSLDVRLPGAELVVYVDAPRYLCLWRALIRMTWSRAPNPDFPLGHRFDFGLLRYIWRFASVSRPRVFELIREQRREGDVIVVRGRRESNAPDPRIVRAAVRLDLLKGHR